MKLPPFFQKNPSIFWLIVSSLALCYYAFYNHYPLVYPDTGSYIRMGNENFLPPGRPMLYGVFLRYISLKASLWLPIFVQGLVVSGLFWLCFKKWGPQRHRPYWFITSVFFLTLLTGISVNVSQLIPDVFTPCVILGFGLWLFAPNLTKWEKIFCGGVILSGLAMHNSHLLILFFMLGLLTAIAGFKYFKKQAQPIQLKKIGTAWGLWVSGIALIFLVHGTLAKEFTLSKGGHVFMMSHLIELGLVQEYLEDNCATKNYNFCEHRNNIPWDFIWDMNSPLHKTGGWDANKEEYDEIIWEVLTTPSYFVEYVSRSIETTFKQFFSFNTGDTPRQNSDSAPFDAVKRHFPHQTMEYNLSRQAMGRLDWDWLNLVQVFVVMGSFFLFLLFVTSERLKSFLPKGLLQVSLFIMLGLWVNALITGTLSTVVDRYQARVVWLLVFVVFLFLIQPATRAFIQGHLRKLVKE